MDNSDGPKTTRRTFVAASAALAAGALSGCESAVPAHSPHTGNATEQASAEPGSQTGQRAHAQGALKPLAQVLSAQERHWVGDGFHVSTLFSPRRVDAQIISPFILMDHAAARQFPPTESRRGVGEHPHRGFETVTFAYQGEIEHQDSQGGGGTIGAGGVQWMTAASGVVHSEMHSRQFARTGGIFEMVQLWVNLPARLKMSTPRYQSLAGTSFPELAFGPATGSATGRATGRLIAGELQGKSGPARTHTPITMFDIEMPASSAASFELPVGMTTLVLVLEGRAQVQDERQVDTGDLMIFDRDRAGAIQLAANDTSRLLVLSGEPLGEPVVAHGPFVMNTREEIADAVRDFQAGRMGTLSPTT